MSLARFGVTKPVPMNILMVAFLIGGVVAGLTMTREFFPETTPESASITLPYPGATPEEIEESLAKKVEDKIADLDEVERLTTTISEGGGGITVEFRDGIDSVTKATDEVERAVDTLQDLPDEAERITVAELEPTLHTIMLSVFGDATERELKRAVRAIRDDLKSIPSIGDIEISGVRDYEVRVDVSYDEMLRYGVSLPAIADQVRAWMTDIPGGTVRTDVGNVNVRTKGVEERAQEIRDIVVRSSADGQVVRLGEIADVEESFTDTQVRTRFLSREPDGEMAAGDSATLTVFTVGDQDAVRIAEIVRSYARGMQYVKGDESATFEPQLSDRLFAVMNEASARKAGDEGAAQRMLTDRRRAYEMGMEAAIYLPEGTNVAIHSDLARFIEGRLDLLIRNARAGAVLVFATLLLFLNWRAAFWVGVGLTTALAGTLMFMNVFGVTLNLLTMFGLIVVLGLLVDDAIVVAENIIARHDRGDPALSAAITGTEEVFWPVVATVMTSIVAFLPLTFIKGQTGDLLGALPWVVACALVMSLVESILILPSHMGHSLVNRDRREEGGRDSIWGRLERWRDHLIKDRLEPAYAWLVEHMLEYRYVSLAFALGTLIISLGLYAGRIVEFNFLPASDSETIIAEVRMPIGTAIDETGKVMRLLEQASSDQPEVSSISVLVGASASVDGTQGVASAGTGTHKGQLFIELEPVESRDRESTQVIQSIREAVLPLENVESLTFTEIQGGPGGAAITIEVRSADEGQAREAARAVKERLETVEDVVDISDNNAVGQREVQINLRPEGAALGLTVADIARQVRGALFGIDAHVFSSKREDIDVRVRLDEQSRRNLHTIENLWIITPMGRRVPLREVADINEGDSYSTIHRVDRMRTITVTAETVPDGKSPEDIVASIMPDLKEIERRYSGVALELAGRQRQLRKAFESLPIGFGAACILIYVILAWLFSSYTQPLAVMLAIPFGVIGVMWGHLLLGYELTFLSLIGFVALAGIVVNDSLILVQFYNGKRADGMPLREALIAAGRQRLRPIMLTTITTVLGLTPLMLEQSFQAKFMIPMAISIAFGLLSATVLILLVLPCMLVIFDDVKAAAYFLWHGEPRPADGAARPAGLDEDAD